MFRRFAASLVLGLALGAAPGAARAAEPGPASAVVGRLHAAMQRAAVRAGEVGAPERDGGLEAVVRSSMAFSTIARHRMGAAWGTLSAAQRAKLTEVVADVVVRQYLAEAAKAGSYSFGPSSENLMTNAAIVSTTVTFGGRSEPRDYVLQQVDGAWLVANRRLGTENENTTVGAEYVSTLKRSGFDGLVASLQAGTGTGGDRPDPRPRTATEFVAALQSKLLSVMQRAEKLGYEGRRRELDATIRETHLIAAIARLTVSQYWGRMSKEQQEQLVTTFGDLVVANYASKFDGYAGERFSQLEEKVSGKSTIVRTVLTKTNGKQHTLDYTLREVGGEWRILNITADGVSDLATKKAEYGSVMGSAGFSGLLAKLREQIRRYESGS
jgi:phospholipid transport system substrate-binding protein